MKLKSISSFLAKIIGGIFFNERNARLTVWRRFKQFFFYEPMFRYRCKKVGKALYFESNFPLIIGYGSITSGDRLRLSGNVTIIVSYKVNADPTVCIGDEVYVGYATVISCAEKVCIGNRVLMAHGVQIFDNNTHPLDPTSRGKNLPVEPENVSPVVIEDDVWIGSHATILKGVTIGRGAVIATHSVVSKDVPPLSVVAGNPARVVKQILSNV